MKFLNEMFGAKGELAVVTGGQGDLGSEYAKTLALAGAKVAIFDIKEEINPKVKKLIDDGYPVVSFKADIAKKSEVDAAMLDLIKHFNDAPTILINNAGLASHPNAPAEESGPFEKYPEEIWDAMLNSHLKGMFNVSQSFIEKYRAAKKKSGSIINVSSTYGVVSPEQAMYEFRRKRGEIYYKPVGYSVAKSGVLNFARWLADYCAYEKLGIRVNTLVPGGVYAGQDQEFVREYEKRTMLGRMATNTDYNGAILFLASKASLYMTGATLVVDGGWTAR
ncbi:MAG: SDR family oxidoreductase [Candidatus Giovannonibacteria bacterium]|nr:SDR family oxidoreductase [Candidatus Giovannonibacteria bacterium]